MKRFVVLGMPRTGSTLLSTGLGQHPRVRCFGELFHQVENERKGPHALNIDGERVYFDPDKDDAIEFLKRNVFCERNADKDAVGFKIFGEYAKGPGSDGLFRRLRSEFPDLYVFHIYRRNYLEILLSRETAVTTKQWVVFAHNREELKSSDRLTIDPVRAQRFFENMRRMDGFFESFYSGERYFKVGYEELDNDFQGTMALVFNFLDLPKHEVEPQTVKQRTEIPKERIANYKALKLAFKGGPFAAFFRSMQHNLAFPSPDEMTIGDFAFDLDASSAVQKKKSVGRRFVLMKRRRLIEDYIALFDDLKPANLFELGIRRGGSMAFYNLAFSPERHVAIELETETIPALDALQEMAENDGRSMRSYYGVNQADKARLLEIVRADFDKSERPLDLVIDDASHRLHKSTLSFEALFPLIREGGIYALEDWGWAHWTEFQGPNAYFAEQAALTNLVFRIIVLHTCHPDIIKCVVINPVVIYIERGPKALDPTTFNIADNLVMRGRRFVDI